MRPKEVNHEQWPFFASELSLRFSIPYLIGSIVLFVPYSTGKLLIRIIHGHKVEYGPPIHYSLSYLQLQQLKQQASSKGKILITRTSALVIGIIFWLLLAVLYWWIS
jgi:hypothetical protein